MTGYDDRTDFTRGRGEGQGWVTAISWGRLWAACRRWRCGRGTAGPDWGRSPCYGRTCRRSPRRNL